MLGNKSGYVSCIKINGTPILPPVVSPELRKELARYKQQAVKLELRLKRCRELKEHLNELMTTQEKSRPASELTFGDNSHIEALNITDNYQTLKERTISDFNLYTTHIQSDNSHVAEKVHSVNNFCDSDEGKNVDTESDNMMTFTPSKPRLIRSNSYTLETPSPILLAHLQKAKESKSESTTKNWVSFDTNPASDSDFDSIKTVCFNRKCDVPGDSLPAEIIGEVKSPTIEVYQTDISVQQITLNNCPSENTKEVKKKLFFNRDPFESFDPDSELAKILSDVPEAAAKQILELLKKQHNEQKERLERYDNLNMSSPNGAIQTENDKSNNKCSMQLDIPHSPDESIRSESETNLNTQSIIASTSKHLEAQSRHASDKLTRSSTFSMSPSQSLYYSISSSAPSTPSVKLIDLESDRQENREIGVFKENNGYWEGVITHDTPNNDEDIFEAMEPELKESLKQHWAATVITAHVRGYLTRKLLQTEKVQSLIATVKEVLLCALELHGSDNIDEKDVELHRRLINQLSAALYTFHDTFFALSKPEQMLIIAADRQRKKEKVKKSMLSTARSLHSSRSNKSLVLSQTSSKSSSLTKV